MPQSLKLRTSLRSSHLGAICIALLFWQAWWQLNSAVEPFIGGACLRLLNRCLHFSRMLPVLSAYGAVWRIRVMDLWIGFLCGLAAVMLAGWLYAPEKQR
jgi:hypothetical protein